MRKRNHIIPLHLNKKELAHLETQVKQSGLPREEFLRTLIMGAELRAKPCDHHADLLHKVAGLCNNANQLAKVANTYGEASQQSVEEMTRLAQAVWKDLKRAAQAYRLQQNVAPHSFRKIYAVDLLEKYGDIERVQRALNHSSPSVTMIYAMADKRLQAGALRKAARCGKRLR